MSLTQCVLLGQVIGYKFKYGKTKFTVFLFKEDEHSKVNEVAETEMAQLGGWRVDRLRLCWPHWEPGFWWVLKRKEPNTWQSMAFYLQKHAQIQHVFNAD